MSQLENTQTVVLQQTDGKKIYLDLNVSTDTTAIESFKQASLVSEKAFEKSTDISNTSFDYATGVAVCLAMCATLLAYWFGARSFNLTKQSFDALILEIQDKKDIDQNKEIRMLGSRYFSTMDDFNYLAKKFEQEHLAKDLERKNRLDQESVEAIKKMEKLLRDAMIIFLNISLHFDTSTTTEQNLIDIVEAIKRISRRYLEDLMNEQERSNIRKIDMLRKEDEKLNKILNECGYTGYNNVREVIAFLTYEFINELKKIVNIKAT